MLERILRQLREKVRTREYVMTLHAEEEMDDDSLTVFDIERCVLTGEIVERQRDTSSGEWKYLLRGQTLSEEKMCLIAKVSPTGKMVVITVYRVEWSL